MQKTNKRKPTFYDLMKFAKTGNAAPGMTAFDKMRALSAFGGFPIASLTGEDEIQFDSDGKPLISWYVKGNEVQDGTPTQSVPIQPQECGEKTGNLMDLEAFLKREGATYTKNGDTFTINMSANLFAHPWYVSDEDTYLSISGIMETLSGTNIRIYIVKKDGTVSGSVALGGTGGVRKTENRLGAGIKFDYTSLGQCTVSNLMLNTGSTALPYEPFGYNLEISCGGQTYNAYLKEPIRKIGDGVDVAESLGVATRRVKKLVLDGTENWQALWGCMSFSLKVAADTTPRTLTLCCSDYLAKTNMMSSQGYQWGNLTCAFRDYASTILIKDDVNQTDKNAWKSYLATQYANGTPVCVWYVLAEPETETFDAPQIQTVKGANTFAVETTLPPSEVGITGHIKATT